MKVKFLTLFNFGSNFVTFTPLDSAFTYDQTSKHHVEDVTYNYFM